MHLQKLVTNYSAYNEWATIKIVDWLKTLEEDIPKKTSPSSYNSIDLTLQHILKAQRFWLAFISEEETSHFNWTNSEGETAEIMEKLRSVSTQMKENFSAFDEAALTQTLQLNMPWKKNELPRYEYILHVINHSSYHRGQIVTIARALGITVNIPNTDYNFFGSPEF